MPTKKPDPNDADQGVKRPDRVITDARAMRAMAHPVRLALLEAMRTEGEITATRAAQLLDDSPGNMSWHLQTLAKYGFIEEAGGGRGRSRPWRIASVTNRFTNVKGDPSSTAAVQALAMTALERSSQLMREWWSQHEAFEPIWSNAAFMTDSINYLTPEELAAFAEQVDELWAKFNYRTDRDKRPEDAMPVHFNAHAHPMLPRASS
jgi:DNA-binding transcriptional ArsR family regulator